MSYTLEDFNNDMEMLREDINRNLRDSFKRDMTVDEFCDLMMSINLVYVDCREVIKDPQNASPFDMQTTCIKIENTRTEYNRKFENTLLKTGKSFDIVEFTVIMVVGFGIIEKVITR